MPVFLLVISVSPRVFAEPEVITIGYVSDLDSLGGREVFTGLEHVVPKVFARGEGDNLLFKLIAEPSFDRLRHSMRVGKLDAAVMYYSPRLFSGMTGDNYTFYPRYFGQFHSYYYALPNINFDAQNVAAMLARYRLGMSRMPRKTAISLVGMEPDYLMSYAQHRSLVQALFRGRVDIMVAYPEVMSIVAESLPEARQLRPVAPAFTLYLALGISNQLPAHKRGVLMQWLESRLGELPDVGNLKDLPSDPPWRRSATPLTNVKRVDFLP